MKIISICGSPRKGNTEWMLTELNRQVEALGISAGLILLRKEEIKPCNGCLACEQGGNERKGTCKISDGMSAVLPLLLEADIIVFGTPVYFDMLSGTLKNFMDRTCPIWPQLSGKGCAGVAVAEEAIGQAVSNIRTYAAICRMRWLGSVSTLARTPKQAATNAVTKVELSKLAEKLNAFRQP